jgi:hypothetical protein
MVGGQLMKSAQSKTKKRIVVYVNPKKLKREFYSAYSNAIRGRLLETEFTRQLIHEAIRLAQEEFRKWYRGKKSMLN